MKEPVTYTFEKGIVTICPSELSPEDHRALLTRAAERFALKAGLLDKEEVEVNEAS